MSGFYELPNSTNDFKSRSNDVFDQLSNLEKQHSIQSKTKRGLVFNDDDEPSTSSNNNPMVPSNAIVFRKRTADETTFARPETKWKKYDLSDVNEHQIGEMSNQRALNDFLRTRVKPTEDKTKEIEQKDKPLFKRPMKKETIIETEDNDEQFDSIRVPNLPINRNEKRSTSLIDTGDSIAPYKLRENHKKIRGVLSTTKKTEIKQRMDVSEENSDDSDKDDDFDGDEPFEP